MVWKDIQRHPETPEQPRVPNILWENRNYLEQPGFLQDQTPFSWCQEVVIKVIKELMKSLTKSVKSAEWLLENGILYHQGKIYVPDSNLCCCISALCHDSKIAGHPGRWKTLELVSRNYWWPQMSRYISKHVSTCDMCLHTKVSHQPSSQRAQPPPCSRCTMGHDQCWFHSGVARVWREKCNHGSSWLGHQMWSLCGYSHYTLSSWNS